jgi:two-component system phosphate regulon response regulator PhoB
MASKKRILIIDDEQDIRTYLSTLLEDHGYETQLAGDGVEAWKQVETKAPDLITLDISMPEKSGVRFYRDLKTDDRLNKIPVIVVTGVSEDFKKFISSRHQVPAPDGFISKPIDQEEILKTIARLLS